MAPNAEFKFIAHLPEWGLNFPIDDTEWGGSLPSVHPETGSTVWGAVFSIPEPDLGAVNEAESMENRTATTVEAMDRSGKRHQVLVHLHDGNGDDTNGHPSARYLEVMLTGSRHWSLPAGWIAGLEEHLENSR